jgi:hypothetical protein
MTVAKRALHRGRFDQASRLISKARKRFKKETAARTPVATALKLNAASVKSGVKKQIAELEAKKARGKELSFSESMRLGKLYAAKRGWNPTGAAAEKLYKDFHGKKSAEVIRLHDALLKAGDYTALGSDPEFWLEPVKGDPRNWTAADIEFLPRDKVKLATDAKGKRLYIVGGSQKMPAEFLKDKETDGRYFNLGTCYGISYQTEKIFDGFQTTTYAHEFGEETGERPELHYDSETKRLLLVGGAYHIADVDKALKASPGIVN